MPGKCSNKDTCTSDSLKLTIHLLNFNQLNRDWSYFVVNCQLFDNLETFLDHGIEYSVKIQCSGGGRRVDSSIHFMCVDGGICQFFFVLPTGSKNK